MITRGYKVLTHDLRPPIQGGDPIFDGTLPYVLPTVKVDQGDAECAAGWNACREGSTGLRIGGLWPDGWPSRLFAVETTAAVIERGDKLRSSTLTLVSEEDVAPHIARMSEAFAPHQMEMTASQLRWREALARPRHDESSVADGLTAALQARELGWKLKRFDSAKDAWDAKDAWAAWDAKAAWAAWDATIWRFAILQGWLNGELDKYDIGIRDAYAAGLHIAVPTGPKQLGWAMVP